MVMPGRLRTELIFFEFFGFLASCEMNAFEQPQKKDE